MMDIRVRDIPRPILEMPCMRDMAYEQKSRQRDEQ